MLQNFLDFQFWRTTFLARTREKSNGFLNFLRDVDFRDVTKETECWRRWDSVAQDASVSVTVIQKEKTG